MLSKSRTETRRISLELPSVKQNTSISQRLLLVLYSLVLIGMISESFQYAVLAAQSSILAGPYLQDVTQSGIVIVWETNSGNDALVEYGLTSRYGNSKAGVTASNKQGTYIHKVRIDVLKPETTYHYRVRTSGVSSPNATFRTAPKKDTPFRFIVWGDNQDGVSNFERLLPRIKHYSPDMLLSVGDVVSRGSNYSGWRTELFTPLKNIANSIPLFVACGNHEYLERDNYWFDQYFSHPDHNHYFSFNYGNSHFIFLDNAEAHTRYGYHPYAKGSAQYEWLVEDLQSPESRNAAFRFVVMHVPPYSRSAWGGEEDTRRDLVPLFETYGVDIVFSGHHHLYEQGRWPFTGFPAIRYVITGGGGGKLFKNLRGSSNDNPWPQVQKNIIGKYHFCLVEVNNRHLTFKEIDENNNEIDAFSIGDSAPLPPDSIRVAPMDVGNQILWKPNHLGNPETFQGVVIYRSTSPDKGFQQIARVDKTKGYYTDRGLTNGQVYYYKLSTRDAALGTGLPSEVIIGVPRLPGNLANDPFEETRLGHFTIVDKGVNAAAPSVWMLSHGKMCQITDIGTANASWDGTFALLGDDAWTDLVLDVDVQNLGNDGIGLVFRYIDRNNYYQFRWDANRSICNIEKVSSTDSTKAIILKAGWLQVGAYTTATYHLRLRVVDSDISVTISGGHLISPITLLATDPTHVRGKVGLYCWSSNLAFFDNLTVATPDQRHPKIMPNSNWPIQDTFGNAGLNPAWVVQDTVPEIISFSPMRLGGDGKVLKLPAHSGCNGTIRIGTSTDCDYSVQAYVYCKYDPCVSIIPLENPTAKVSANFVYEIEDTFLFFDPTKPAIGDRSFGGDEDEIVGTPLYRNLRTRIARALMRIDLSPLVDAPPTITEARLKMKIRRIDGPAPVITLYRISAANGDWSETPSSNPGVPSWNNKIAGQSWAGSPGLGTADIDYNPIFLAQTNLSSASAGDWATFKFTVAGLAAIKDWIAGNNAGFLIRSSSEGQGHVRFYSADSTPIYNRPIFEIGSSKPTSESVFSSPASVVISQIHDGSCGFVELHNRTAEDVVLKNWSLQCSPRSASHWTTTQGDVLTLNIKIPALGYYLVGTNKKYTLEKAIPDKIWAEASLAGFSKSGASVALVCNTDPLQSGIPASDPDIVDLVGWGDGSNIQHEGSGNAPNPSANQSIIRKANAKSTSQSMSDGGADALASNSYDSNDNSTSFVIRNTPFPRNSQVPNNFSGPGVFLREDGTGRFVDGNCYYLVWDPAKGRFHAGKSVEGEKIDFSPLLMPKLCVSAWRCLRIDADKNIISYWVDNKLLVRVIDYSHHMGLCGLGYRSSSGTDKLDSEDAFFDSFEVDSTIKK